MSLSRLLERPHMPGFLDGQFLVAMPTMEDDRFRRSVIYMCAHSREGAMGIVINHPAPHVTFPDLLVQLKIIPEGSEIRLPSAEEVSVVQGGPVEQARGFLLHTPDVFIENSTLPIDDGVCLTATLDILKAIASGRGPKRAILALGYAAWSPSQLEGEIQDNGWLTCPGNIDMIFDPGLDTKYDRAMKSIGVDLASLASECGRA